MIIKVGGGLEPLGPIGVYAYEKERGQSHVTLNFGDPVLTGTHVNYGQREPAHARIPHSKSGTTSSFTTSGNDFETV